jgi:Phage integrase, N-terminal SAM-like domain
VLAWARAVSELGRRWVRRGLAGRVRAGEYVAALLTSVFFVDAEALGRWDRLGSVAAAERWLADFGLPEGMPFLLHESGVPDRMANRWLASLPTHGCRSRSTWRAYALNWAEWARFLQSRGVAPLAVTAEDVAAFYSAQRLDRGGAGVGRATWNRKVAALESFYKWAIDRGLVASSPFVYREAWARGSDGVVRSVRRNLAKERAGRPHATLRWLESDRLQLFLAVGLAALERQPRGGRSCAARPRRPADASPHPYQPPGTRAEATPGRYRRAARRRPSRLRPRPRSALRAAARPARPRPRPRPRRLALERDLAALSEYLTAASSHRQSTTTRRTTKCVTSQLPPFRGT